MAAASGPAGHDAGGGGQDARQGPGRDPATERMVQRLAALTGHETPSGHRPGLEPLYDLLEAWAPAGLGTPRRIVSGDVPHLYWPAPESAGAPVLVLCHADTVWPVGTLAERPFRREGDRITGPGVFDMKAGLVIAMDALARVRAPARVSMLVTGDEEAGSLTSRELIEEAARGCSAVLVLEPGEGDAAKTARKGAAFYRISFRGRAAHAGLEPEKGVNALVELAHQVLGVGALADPQLGTTVTPTVAHAGTTTNVVPGAAELCVDVRAWSTDELRRVDRALTQLSPRSADVGVTVDGGVNRYALEEAQSAQLLALARSVAAARGLPDVGSARVGGASDGNFTAALGIPTLDGIGARGDGAHAVHEWVDAGCLVPRSLLLAGLIDALGEAR